MNDNLQINIIENASDMLINVLLNVYELNYLFIVLVNNNNQYYYCMHFN
jgi:hypothetical protein